jgi:rRNA-processing protein FCF1
VTTVFVDAENVRRSKWPNVAPDELVRLVRAWAERAEVDAVVVFDGRAPDGAVGTEGETADDWIARAAAEADGYWLVTSDRGLRARAGERAERVVGGGSFLREIL